MERDDGNRRALPSRSQSIPQALPRRRPAPADTAHPQVRGGRLQLPAPGPVRRACLSAAAHPPAVGPGARLHRRRVRHDRAASAHAVARGGGAARAGRRGDLRGQRASGARHARRGGNLRENARLIRRISHAERLDRGVMAQHGQVVLVLQGGGALGAYHGGVYQAMHEAGLEPDWVIGTSIGAINGAIIAGNPAERRLERLREFWSRVEQSTPPVLPQLNGAFSHWATLAAGVSGFFRPRAPFWVNAPVGVERASYYSAAPLRETLAELVDLNALAQKKPRLTIGAVNVPRGEMRYFDNRHMALTLEHVMASGALPPAFGAVRIDGEAYWG